MKTNLLKILIVPVVLGLLVGGCSLSEPDHPTGLEPQPVFSSYVSIGNSLTAGYMDAGLMQAGQANSYPRLIANQIGFDNTQFTQPWVAAPGIGSTNTGDPTLVAGVLRFDGSGLVPLGVTPITQVPGLLLAMAQPLPYSNLGVPGATLHDVFSAYNSATSQASGNSFFDFINRDQLYGNASGTATVFELDGTTPKDVTYQTSSMGWQAIAEGPTLVTVWIGNNDVLGGATSGNPTQFNMTPPATFASMYSDMMQLLAGGLLQRTGFPSTIVVANIPNVTDIPYFMTEATFNQVLEAQTGGQVTSWPGGYAEGSAQLLTIRVLSWLQANLGNPATPIPAEYTMTPVEVATVTQYVTAYNGAIAQIVAGINASGMAKVGLVDMTAVLGGLDPLEKTHFLLLVQQMPIATAANTTLFSLDGVHPNNRGYGVIANEFIAVINATAGTNLPDVNTAALSWDPTYGVPVTTKAGGVPHLSEQAAAAMTAIWR